MTTTQTTKDIHWDDAAILAAAGTKPEAVRALLARHGQPLPTDMAIYQWHSRRVIPDSWRPRVLYALLREQKITLSSVFRLGSGRRRTAAA